VRSYAGWLRRGSAATALVLTLGMALSQPMSAHAASTTPTPVRTCTVLAQGATGPAVKTIQAAIGTPDDGDFGPATAKALRLWQKAHEVAASGVVDAATWAALPVVTGQRACGQKVSGTGVTLTCATLSSGSEGLAVAVLQKTVGTTVNGVYGPPTVDAVEMIQQAAKLKVTGVTNANTWKALKLLGTPECSTAATVGPRQPADAKAQAKIRARVDRLVVALEKRPGTSTNPVALQAMAFEKRQIGKPYVWGGIGPKGYDCSGLQMTSYLHAGLTIPRTAAEQYAGAGKHVPLNDAQQGDLLFYASDVTKPSTVYHVAMYVGGGQLLDSPQTGENVQIDPLWTTDLLPYVVRPVAGLTLPVKVGATGWTVTQLQQDLNRHGNDLTINGSFGKTTEVAVRAWQKAHKVTANGIVDVTTWLTLD
jgi:cell wall-associated NlpC family hydrolase